MDKLQKTIKGLRCHSEPKFGPDEYFCETCPYDEATCGLDVPNDALSLLKAQEPRILDYEELKKEAGKIAVWPEITMGDGHKELFAPCTPIFMIDKPETIGLKSTGNILFMDEHAYKTEGGFVCWSSRPTDEQREATPWKD